VGICAWSRNLSVYAILITYKVGQRTIVLKKARYLVIVVILLFGAILIFPKAKKAYQLHVVRTQFAKLTPAIQVLIEQAKSYAEVWGHFPNAYELNLTTIADDDFVTDPAALSPYFGGVVIDDFEKNSLNIEDISESGPCGAIGVIGSALDVELLGFPREFADNAADNGFECYYWNYENQIYTQCFYGFGTSEVSQVGDIIPGWINVNTSSDWDFKSNYRTYEQNGFQKPTCQR
jgi:hypothetical protein